VIKPTIKQGAGTRLVGLPHADGVAARVLDNGLIKPAQLRSRWRVGDMGNLQARNKHPLKACSNDPGRGRHLTIVAPEPVCISGRRCGAGLIHELCLILQPRVLAAPDKPTETRAHKKPDITRLGAINNARFQLRIGHRRPQGRFRPVMPSFPRRLFQLPWRSLVQKWELKPGIHGYGRPTKVPSSRSPEVAEHGCGMRRRTGRLIRARRNQQQHHLPYPSHLLNPRWCAACFKAERMLPFRPRRIPW
jgi:hypothetical protein